jgi:7-cyano-7-deazaguanine synthase in queuosine biosynthesis
MSEKRKLVLYSGGMDSTHILRQLVSNKEPFDVLYVHTAVHPLKKKKELEVREKFLASIRQKEDYPWSVREYECELDWWNCCKKGDRLIPHWNQPQTWAVAAARAFNPERHSALVVGYLMEETGKLPIIKQLWSAMSQLSWGEEFPLEVPLAYLSKEQILRDSPDNVFETTWVCECPIERETIHRCGNCAPCRRMDAAFLTKGVTNHNIKRLKAWNAQLERPEEANLSAAYFEQKYEESNARELIRSPFPSISSEAEYCALTSTYG